MYLAGLAGNNNLEIAEVHMIWDTVQETFNVISPIAFMTDPTEKASIINDIIWHEISLGLSVKSMHQFKGLSFHESFKWN